MKDSVALRNGPLIVNVHEVTACAGQHCVIHNPSGHHMLLWEPVWDGMDKSMWRRCPHGFNHPDPDDVAFQRRRSGHEAASFALIHGCDGCCQAPAKEIGDGKEQTV